LVTFLCRSKKSDSRAARLSTAERLVNAFALDSKAKRQEQDQDGSQLSLG
jgi:hypothetical protein